MADTDRRHIDRKAEEDKQAFILASVEASNAEAAELAGKPNVLVQPEPISVESAPAPIEDPKPAATRRRSRKAK